MTNKFSGPKLQGMEIRTIDELGAAFGSKSELARFVGVTRSAVSQWETLPSRYHRLMMEHARRKRWSLADSLFEAEERNAE